ncbi:MAG: DMT family transporter [Clostridia bacterium]|nr:DMT family transporter [Clostridia bacterium]
MKRSAHRRAILALILVTVIWGSGFIATAYAIASQLHVGWIMMIRFFVGALLIGAVFRRRVFAAGKRGMLHGIGAGIILFGAFYTQTLGQGMTQVSHAALITATNVVMIPFLLWLLTKKRPGKRVFLLSLMTMLGVVLLNITEDMQLTFGKGEALVLLCALLFALHITYLDLVCAGDDPVQVAFWQLAAAAACGGAVLLLTRPAVNASQFQKGLAPVVYLGLFSTGLCYFLQTWAQKHVRASEAGIVLSCEGMFGTIFSLLLGMEHLRPAMLAGGGIITLSVILSETWGREGGPS